MKSSAKAVCMGTRVRLLALCLCIVCVLTHCRQNDEADHAQYRKLAAQLDSMIFSTHGSTVFEHVDSLLRTQKNMSAYGKIVCYAYRARGLSGRDELEASRRCMDTVLRIFKQTGLGDKYPVEYAHAMLEAGRVLTRQRKYDEALEYYTRAKQLSGNNSCIIGDYSYHIAMVLYKQQKYEQAASYFKESFLESLNCPQAPQFHKQEVLDNIGLSYSMLKNYDSSTWYYDSALVFIDLNATRFDHPEMARAARAVVYNNKGNDLLNQGYPDSAIVLYGKCIQTKPILATPIVGPAMVPMAGIYLRAEKYPQTFAVLQQLDSSLMAVYDADQKNAWQEQMVAYYKGTGQFAKAMVMLQQYHELKDSIAVGVASVKANDVEKDVKSKEQQYQITLLKKDNELNKLYLWITVACSALFVAIIAIVVFNYRRSRRISEQIRKQNEELAQLNREKDKILSVVAHDLRNPIGVISYLADLMIEDGEERPEQEEESLNEILTASQQSLALITELLELKDAVHETGATINKGNHIENAE